MPGRGDCMRHAAAKVNEFGVRDLFEGSVFDMFGGIVFDTFDALPYYPRSISASVVVDIKDDPLVQVCCSASIGAWLSLVERTVRDREVGGSNPLAPTNNFKHLRRSGTVAVLVLWQHLARTASTAG